MKTFRLSVVCVSFVFMGLAAPVQAAVIDAYFGMNFVEAGAAIGPAHGFEVDLLSITYLGGGGGTFTTAMPVFPGTQHILTAPRTGLPDIEGLSFTPTYTTVPNGDGETTRTIGATVPINWSTNGAFPQIQILSIRVDSAAVAGIWTASFGTPYTVGLIPTGTDTELTSLLSDPQGDIYNQLAGAVGNTVGTSVATSAPPGLESFVGSTFGNFSFAAAAVPVPATAWLFGSGLLGLIGVARRKTA